MNSYSLSDFGHITSAKLLVSTKVFEGELPGIDEVKTLAQWSEGALELFNTDAATAKGDGFDRSQSLQRIAYYGAELGWSDPQIMSVLLELDNTWGKYAGRRDREHRYLLPMVNRARQKHGYDTSATDLAKSALLSKPITEEGGLDRVVWGFQDFVESEFHIEWLLKDLLPQQGYGFIVAHPGVGKTTLAIQLAAHLALGYEKFLHWNNVGGAKKVMLLSLEMGAPPLHLFLQNIGKSYEDKRLLNKNLLVAPLGKPIYFDTEAGQKYMDALIEEHKPDVLVIDSLQKISSMALTDEQASKSLTEYIGSVRNRYKTAVVVIHHNRKKPNDAQKKSVELSDVFGSTYLTADVDFVLNLHVLTKETLMLTVLKTRLGPPLDPFEIHRDENLRFSADFENLMEQFENRGENSVFSLS